MADNDSTGKVSKTQLAVAMVVNSKGTITAYAAAQAVGIDRRGLLRAIKKLEAQASNICPTCKRPLDDTHLIDPQPKGKA